MQLLVTKDFSALFYMYVANTTSYPRSTTCSCTCTTLVNPETATCNY